jgi:hypothetical protein
LWKHFSYRADSESLFLFGYAVLEHPAYNNWNLKWLHEFFENLSKKAKNPSGPFSPFRITLFSSKNVEKRKRREQEKRQTYKPTFAK